MEAEDKDYFNLKYEKHLIDLLRKMVLIISFFCFNPVTSGGLEQIIFSAEVTKDVFLFFKKAKFIIDLQTHIFIRLTEKEGILRKRTKLRSYLA